MTASSFTRRDFFRFSALGGVALAGSSALAACGRAADTATTAGSSAAGGAFSGTINVQLSWIKNIEFAGEYHALEKGYFTQSGVPNTINLVSGGAAATGVEQALATSKAWIGMSAPNLTAPAILSGAPIKTVAATFQKNPFSIVSGTGKPIRNPEEMKGKKIGVQQSNTVIFDALLAANKINKSDLTIVPVQYDPTPLITGEVDGWLGYITNEPILLKGKGFENTTYLFADFGLPLVAETLVVRQETIDNDRDLLKAFLKAEVMGWRDAVADPAQSAKYAVEKYGKDQNLELAEQTEEAIAQNGLVVSDETKANGLLTMSDKLVEQNISALKTAGITITADQLFDLSLIKEVFAENPELKG